MAAALPARRYRPKPLAAVGALSLFVFIVANQPDMMVQRWNHVDDFMLGEFTKTVAEQGATVLGLCVGRYELLRFPLGEVPSDNFKLLQKATHLRRDKSAMRGYCAYRAIKWAFCADDPMPARPPGTPPPRLYPPSSIRSRCFLLVPAACVCYCFYCLIFTDCFCFYDLFVFSFCFVAAYQRSACPLER